MSAWHKYFSWAKAHTPAGPDIAVAMTFGLSFVLYAATMARTVTLEYSGQLVTAADHLGVARPLGYPVWTLMAKGFSLLFSWVPYRGYPNPALGVNVLSVFFGAVTCALLARIISRESTRFFTTTDECETSWLSKCAAVSAVAGSLLFGCSPAFWSQAVIAETHTLTCAFFLLQVDGLLLWLTDPKKHHGLWVPFLAGLGLSVSPLLILTVPLVLLVAAMISVRIFIRNLVGFGLFLGFVAAEYLIGPDSPSGAALLLGAAVGLAGLFLGVRPLRPIGILFSLLLIGLLPYAYIPLAASHNAPMNMGYACTWDGFWHVLYRGQYERLTILNPLAHPRQVLDYLTWYVHLVRTQFTGFLVLPAFIPVLCFPMLSKSARRSLVLLLTAFILYSAVVLLGVRPHSDIQTTNQVRYAFLPSFAVLAVWIGWGLFLLLRIGGGSRGQRGFKRGGR